jgi:hypothetical protein
VGNAWLAASTIVIETKLVINVIPVLTFKLFCRRLKFEWRASSQLSDSRQIGISSSALGTVKCIESDQSILEALLLYKIHRNWQAMERRLCHSEATPDKRRVEVAPLFDAQSALVSF